MSLLAFSDNGRKNTAHLDVEVRDDRFLSRAVLPIFPDAIWVYAVFRHVGYSALLTCHFKSKIVRKDRTPERFVTCGLTETLRRWFAVLSLLSLP